MPCFLNWIWRNMKCLLLCCWTSTCLFFGVIPPNGATQVTSQVHKHHGETEEHMKTRSNHPGRTANSCGFKSHLKLVGGLEHLFCSIVWESSSQLTDIFQRGWTTNRKGWITIYFLLKHLPDGPWLLWVRSLWSKAIAVENEHVRVHVGLHVAFTLLDL